MKIIEQRGLGGEVAYYKVMIGRDIFIIPPSDDLIAKLSEAIEIIQQRRQSNDS